MINILIQLLHLIIVTAVILTFIISTNKYTLLLLFMAVGIIFIQAIILNGCILTKFEANVPFTDYKGTEIIRSFLSLKKQDVSIESLEKILIGLTLGFIALKLVFLLIFEYIFNNTYYNQICIFLGSRKSGYERLLANFIN